MAKLAQIKTKQNNSSVEDFINTLSENKQKDALELVKLMEDAVCEKPMLWGKDIIGFGKKVYKSPTSGREVEWFRIGFAPRKSNFSLHLVFDVQAQADLLHKLGKHKTGSGCLYIQKLADINVLILKELIKIAVINKL